MRKSARGLGQKYGLTAAEVNFILKESGFLEGEPGNYTITERGAEYAEEQDHHRGVGGYSWYNKSWTTRTWNEEILDELDITNDRKMEIRQAITIAGAKTTMPEDCLPQEYGDCYYQLDTEEVDDEALVAAIGALLLMVSAYGVYKAAPRIKQWWRNKAVPNLKNMKNRIIRVKKEDLDKVKGLDDLPEK